MEEDVTVVDESNCDTILTAAPKILDLFDVRVERLDAADEGVFKSNAADGRVTPDDDSSPSDKLHTSDDHPRIAIHLAANNDEYEIGSVNKAKAYMRCLTCDDSLRHVHSTQYDTDTYAALQQGCSAIERQTQAVITCDDNTRTVTISGLCDNVAMATALANRMVSNIAQSHVTLGLRTSGVDDATCQNTKPVAPRHQGLFRTVSGNNNSIPKSQSDSAMCKKKALCRTRTLQEELTTAAYADKIEFALKLGYTEDQLRCVLEKLGWHVGKNELLRELVQLGALDKSDTEIDLNRSGHSDSEIDLSGCDLDITGNSDTCSEQGETNSLRPIVIDGSNVAMSHGNKTVFSCKGIQLAVDWFADRGHTDITVFVPQWRKETSRRDTQITGQEILTELEKQKVLVFTPARRVCGKRIVCYDDRYIIKLAAETGGVVVSNDYYMDLIKEAAEYKKVIEERLLMYSFVNDRFMPPDDPLGRRGPSLDNFLRMAPLLPEPLPPMCPYGKKCTYGNKCRYYHPERGMQPHRSVVEKLSERADKNRLAARGHPVASPTNSLTGGSGQKSAAAKTPVKRALTKTRSLVTGGCVSKTLLEARNSTCCSNITSDVNSDAPDTHITKMMMSPDDFDMSQMTVSVKVIPGDITDTPGLFHQSTEPATLSPEDQKMVSRGLPTMNQCNSGAVLHHGMHDLPPPGGPMGAQTNEPWACSPNVLLPSRSEPVNLHLGGHLSLARKLSDESSLSLKGAEDPWLSSIDGATKQQSQADWFYEAKDAEKRFVSNSARSSPKLEGQVDTDGATESGVAGFRRRKSCGKVTQYDLLHKFRNDHSPLNRNLSAPVTTATALPFPRSSGTSMQRQSSTSDPLLHAKDDNGYLLMPTELPPGGCVVATPPVSWSFSTEKQFQHRSPVHRTASASAQAVTSLGPNHQIKVAFTPMGQQPYPAGQCLVGMGGGAMMDPFISHVPNHMIPTSRQQAEVMRSYSNVPSRVHVQTAKPMNVAAQQHLIPNLSRPPPSYQVAPPAADVSDKRRNLYFHLCGLFPEEKVIRVMQQYPTETNPQMLCSHLIHISYV